MKSFALLAACSFLAANAALAAPLPAPAFVARKWTPQFTTYLGGSQLDGASGIAVDSAGNFYVAGVSGSPNFPGDTKPADTKRADAFLCKFSPSYQLLWSRFIGGTGFDQARGVALDKAGHVYLVGNCENGDIPLLNAPRLRHAAQCAFLARFSTEGELQMATELGSDSWTYGQEIAVDGAGNIWLAGTMRGSNFPTKDGTLNATSTPTGNNDVWVSKMAPSGELLFSALLGGSEDESLGGLVLAPDGGVALSGTTASTNFPVVKAIQPTFGGAGTTGDIKGDAWIAVLDASGKTRYATYFGGRSSDVGGALSFAPNGDLLLTGSSDSRDLPLKELLPGGDQASGPFLARFKGDGTQLLQSTFVPGAPRNGAFLNVEPKGDFWLGSEGGYSSNSYQLTHFSATATQILETISGPKTSVRSVAHDGKDNFYLTGDASPYLSTRRALMTTSGGSYDAFVAVLKVQQPTAPNAAPVTITIDAPATGLTASGTTSVGDDGEVQVALYRSADSTYWTGTEWSTARTWLGATVTGQRWTLAGLPQGANLPPGDYYLHAVAVAGSRLETFLGPEYSGEGRAKTSRKIVVAP